MNKIYLVGKFMGLNVQAAVEVASRQEAELLKPLMEKHKILSDINICDKTIVPIQQALLKKLDKIMKDDTAGQNKIKEIESLALEYLHDKDVICLG